MTSWGEGPPVASRARVVAVVVATVIAGYVVLASLAVLAGLFVTRELVHGAVGTADVDVVAWFANRRTVLGNSLSRVGSGVSGTVTVLVILAVMIGVLAWRRHWRQLTIVVVAIFVEAFVYATATYFITRDRPVVPRLEKLVVEDSFFSGHVAAAVALYGSLAVVVWLLTRRPVVRASATIVAIVAPLVVAWSRMYRGMHYPSDVTVGALVGLGCIGVGLLAAANGSRAAASERAARPTTDAPSVERVVEPGAEPVDESVDEPVDEPVEEGAEADEPVRAGPVTTGRVR